MLGEGLLAAAGDEDRAVLKAHQLGAQRGDETRGGGMAGELEQPPMQDRVLVRSAEQITTIQHRAHPLEDLPQVDNVGVPRACGGMASREALERRAGFKNLDRLSLVDETDVRPPVRHVRDESLGLEPRERGAHRGAPDAKRPGEIGLNEALIGLQPAGHDRIANRVLGSLRQIVDNLVDHGPLHDMTTVKSASGLTTARRADCARRRVDVRCSHARHDEEREMLVLDARRSGLVRRLCQLIVPGSERVSPEVYIDALLARMPDDDRELVLGAFDALEPAAGGTQSLAERALTPEFMMVRALACEAFYSDFVAPGAPGPGAWTEIDFAPPLAARLNKDWSYLGVTE